MASKWTIAEIVEEMRTKDVERNYDAIMRLYASRIERAYKSEVEGLRECLKEAIYSACVKCTLYNSRRRQCSYSSGACNDVAKWRKALEGAKNGK